MLKYAKIIHQFFHSFLIDFVVEFERLNFGYLYQSIHLLVNFVDKDDSVHKSISGLSLIVLRAKNGEIKKLRKNLVEKNLLFTDFTETMTGDTYKEQLDKTLETSEDDMKYFCVVTFGEKEVLDPLTRKFSLWH